MKKCIVHFALGVILLLTPAAVVAQVKLPRIFGDNMVLQQGKKVVVWGEAAPRENITVTFQQQTEKTQADEQGRWQVKLDELKATKEPQQLTVQGATNKVVLNNVLIGEVWLASGQSNMEYTMNKQYKHAANTKRYNPDYFYGQYEKANSPLIRVLFVKQTLKADTLPSKGWQLINQQTLAPVSAAGYFFALTLMEKLDVPVGLISTSWGGTPIETWIPTEAYLADEQLKEGMTPEKIKGIRMGERFRKMVEPMAPYALRGFLWYQGETNLTNGDRAIYTEKQRVLMESWRAAWNDDKLSFYYVQLAPHTYTSPGSEIDSEVRDALPLFREAQTACLQLPYTGMVVTTDLVDDPADIHPSYKWIVGERLARWALAKDYGCREVVYSGPTFKQLSLKGDKIILEFDHAASGLITADGKAPDWFYVQDAQGNYLPAEALLEGDQVILPRGDNPGKPSVRFGWNELAMPNLMNREGLPAVPFRTPQ